MRPYTSPPPEPTYARDEHYTEYQNVYDHRTKQHLDTLAEQVRDQLTTVEDAISDAIPFLQTIHASNTDAAANGLVGAIDMLRGDPIDELLVQLDSVVINIEDERDELITDHDDLLDRLQTSTPASTAGTLLHELTGRLMTEQPSDTLAWVEAALREIAMGPDKNTGEQERMSDAIRMVV